MIEREKSESQMSRTDAQHLYILGHPVSHSKSPVMYNALYGKMGLPWHYDFMDCASVLDAEAFIHQGLQGDWLSINITTPYKPEAYEAATHKAATAELSKGVNVLVSHNGSLLGYNVDGEGCIRYLEREGVRFTGKSVVVCGSGPTSVSILNAAVLAGAGEVTLIGRDKDRASRVMARYLKDYRHLLQTAIDVSSADEARLSFADAYERCDFKYGSYTTSTKALSSSDVIIDATPLGMNEGDGAPFDTACLREGQVVMDTVYGHGETALIKAANDAGCKAFDGAGMLVSQAAITATIVCEIKGIDMPYSYDELFELMYAAAFSHV